MSSDKSEEFFEALTETFILRFFCPNCAFGDSEAVDNLCTRVDGRRWAVKCLSCFHEWISNEFVARIMERGQD